MRVPSHHVLPRLRLLGPIALAWMCGCSGAIGEDAGKVGGNNTTGGNTTGGNVGPTTVKPVSAECAAAVHPGTSLIRRLTRFEYNNTVLDLFGDTTQPATALPPRRSRGSETSLVTTPSCFRSRTT